ncbi:MAG: glycosyltransferase, partial [Actinobacteria bacterium]|nr:glycosyltransferase [Actinomycetota bacterium]
MTPDVVPASVVVCTIGRSAHLRTCLETLARCAPRAAELLVVDQSGGHEVSRVVAEFAAAGARRVACSGRGVGRARNLGFATAAHEIVLVTDDDCTVAPDWVGRAWRHVTASPDGIVTGRVLPAGGADAVPSTIESSSGRSYTAAKDFSVLYTGNMAVSRLALRSIGGFDERISPAATDNDLCYRWLKAGRPMRYEPDLVVWHHDWRTPAELERRYVGYAVGQGMFYAKHLRQGDWAIARDLVHYAYQGCRGAAARIVHGRPRSGDWRQG